MKSIRTKLVVYALILVLVPFLFSNIANYFYMSTSYEKELKHDNEVSAQLIGSEIASFIDKGYAITEQLIMNSDIIGFDPDKQKAVLMNVLDRNAYFDLLYVQDATGMQTAKTSGELGNRSERWWFIKAMEEKVSFVSNSYYSITGNVAVTTIAMPIFNWDNQCIGVMGADIKLDALQKIVDGYSEGSKYAFIVDGEGAVIAHPDTEQVKKLYNYVTMKKTELSTDESGNVIFDDKGNQVTEEIDIQVPETLQKIVSLALDGQTGSEIYKNNEGVEVISAYSSITLPGTSDSWAVITVENKSDAFHFISTSLIFSIFLCIVSIVLTIILVSIIAKRISTPIKKSAEYLSKLSTGDFSIEVDSKLMAKRDETGTIAKGIQEMKEALKSLVASITKESQSINEAIGSVTANMSQLNAHIESVSATTEEFAASTEESAASSEEISATSHEIERVAQGISDNSQRRAIAAKEISIRAKKTRENIINSQEKAVQVLMETKEQLQNAINESKAVEQINILTESILAITNQMNLLALNAAIEAARAGEAGKGFSVVASEIREFAEQSKIAVSKIQDISSKVTLTVNNLSKSSSSLLNYVTTDVSKDYNNMLSVAEQYNEDAKFVDELVSGFSATAESLMVSIDEILQGIDGVARATNESAIGTTDIANRVSEASMKSNEVTQKMQRTKASVDILRKEVLKFKL